MTDASAHADVIVIGAGIAGLTAAAELARAGRRVVVREARDRLGGRVRSIGTGTGAVDLGATWFWANEPLTRTRVDGLGLGTFPQHVRGDAMFEDRAPCARRLEGNPIDVAATRFEHGAGALAEGMAAQLPRGSLRLGDPVSAVVVSDDRVHVVARSGTLTASEVVVAVPPALAVERIAFDPGLPGDLRQAAEGTAVWMSDAVKAVAISDEPFWRSDDLSGAALSHAGPFSEFHDHSGPAADPAALFAPAPVCAHAAPAELEDALRGQLARLFGPRARRPRAVHTVDWSRERFTAPTGSATRRSTALFGAAAFQRPAHGRLHRASTETATAFAGHIEGGDPRRAGGGAGGDDSNRRGVAMNGRLR